MHVLVHVKMCRRVQVFKLLDFRRDVIWSHKNKFFLLEYYRGWQKDKYSEWWRKEREKRNRGIRERRVRFCAYLLNETVDLSPGEGVILIASWKPASWQGCTHTRTRTHARTHTRARTYARTHARTHTHTHTHTQALGFTESFYDLDRSSKLLNPYRDLHIHLFLCKWYSMLSLTFYKFGMFRHVLLSINLTAVDCVGYVWMSSQMLFRKCRSRNLTRLELLTFMQEFQYNRSLNCTLTDWYPHVEVG